MHFYINYLHFFKCLNHSCIQFSKAHVCLKLCTYYEESNAADMHAIFTYYKYILISPLLNKKLLNN